MIQEACAMIERVEARERRSREAKYGRRNKIRYIDRLLNELEMLNLADETRVPERLAMELGRLLSESEVVQVTIQPRLESVNEAMDVLYELQDSLMFNDSEEE
jgi:predicted metal-dependent TIM-barrel fold hydrolase